MGKEDIERVIRETAERLGYMVYESGILLKGENSRITVKIDSVAGISHQDCERFSRELAAGIDAGDLLPNYSLEVSSPGLKRRLRSGEEFRRFIGAPVKVVYAEGEGRRVIKGAIVTADDHAVMIASETEERTVPYAGVVSANLDY